MLKDLHQTDTFSVTYLAFTGIPILMDVTHQQCMCHRATLDASSVPKSACCSILDDARKENISMLLKSTIIFFMGWYLLL